MAGKMDAFNKAIKEIEKANPSEINGDLADYFEVLKKENGTYNLKWVKNISTHIRHKVAKLVKQYYIPEPVKVPKTK
ncbi:hypothetical protein [Mucilaginibacter sp. dw_454]|uniref:hypothetical protein n=1 Tax=Mucilaginibacter sp. dw_454 TaxID=2720079 RepID=UPI001BD63E7D|nr:hypothetical protein [Mucilaginibacter sp. dw_454]